jgi:hypothetical protein
MRRAPAAHSSGSDPAAGLHSGAGDADGPSSGGLTAPDRGTDVMEQVSRSSSARRRRGHLVRAALVPVIAGVALVAVPGTASAGSVTPVLNCTTPAAGGGFTAVVGYDNTTGQQVTIPYGKQNRIVPGQFDEVQPTVFAAGQHDGAFSVTVTTSSATWTLGSQLLLLKPSEGPACPSATELPEEGNGTGPAIALAVAGVVGAVTVHRIRRRSLAAAGAHAEERDDA